ALKEYHLLPSVRGDLLARLGRRAEARAEFERRPEVRSAAPWETTGIQAAFHTVIRSYSGRRALRVSWWAWESICCR
ncbi:hypothetical protein, partial [Streptomyces sp. NPDC005407]|uniref:hypothetical protein n=1 Tax=Streptomyces sp. NPDC005407 TaxID=3155340 RepID=UPI0033B68764